MDGLYFRRQRELSELRERIARERGPALLEADVKPCERFLMERFISDGMIVRGSASREGRVWHFVDPQLRACPAPTVPRAMSIDIETVGLDGDLLSIAAIDARGGRVFMVASRPDGSLPSWPDLPASSIAYYPDARGVLSGFFAWVQAGDPDLLLGWNVIDFDLTQLERHCKVAGLEFRIGRGGAVAKMLAPRGQSTVTLSRVPGRVALDGIATLRSATFMFESYALGHVAFELLGRDKAIESSGEGGAGTVAEIVRMHAEDPVALARYNLVDCQLVLDIFARARLLEFALERQRLTGLALDRQGGSVAAFDHLYLPRLHRSGYVAPSVRTSAVSDAEHAPGGHVMDSVPGLYRNILVLDFKSLYPAIIRSFCIDPLGLAQPGPDPVVAEGGAKFARQGHILPRLIAELWAARDAAKVDANAALSRAIKIIMNSFYGVLGSPGCRFFDTRLAASITRWGHRILVDSRAFIEGQDLRVIYGDTDSVFVAVDPGADEAGCAAIGTRLARELNDHWRARLQRDLGLDSQLEIEFETHYLRFFMPTMRGSERGSKKRYAGSVRQPGGAINVAFTGLEAVRSDWTPLARKFQRELFRRVFMGEPHEAYLRSVVRRLRAGELDAQLVYRKRLRRPLDDYAQGAPPQVRAARLARDAGHPVGRSIRYVITTMGPVPDSLAPGNLDYEHYIERQLAPAAEGLLQCLGSSFEDLVGSQLSLSFDSGSTI